MSSQSESKNQTHVQCKPFSNAIFNSLYNANKSTRHGDDDIACTERQTPLKND